MRRQSPSASRRARTQAIFWPFLWLDLVGFCAYIVIVNLCADPTHYTLELPAELPERVQTAQHQFRAVRNVSLDGRRLADELEGFGSAVLRVGCVE